MKKLSTARILLLGIMMLLGAQLAALYVAGYITI